jgi:hypothetical protein
MNGILWCMLLLVAEEEEEEKKTKRRATVTANWSSTGKALEL